MEIENYFQYYRDQECLMTSEINGDFSCTQEIDDQIILSRDLIRRLKVKIQPILRRLSSITEQEAKELLNIIWFPINKERIENIEYKYGKLWSFKAFYFSFKGSEYCIVIDESRNGVRIRGTIDLSYGVSDINYGSRVIDVAVYNVFNATDYLIRQGFWVFGEEAFDKGIVLDRSVFKGEKLL